MGLTKKGLKKGVAGIWVSTIDILISHPKILMPFLILGAIQTLVLLVFSFSAYIPLIKVFGPPIRQLWGEAYLHYPYFYSLVPKMFFYGKLAVDIVIGSLTAGMAIILVKTFADKRNMGLGEAVAASGKRYVSLFLLVIFLFGSVNFLIKQPGTWLVKYFIAGHHAKLLFLGPQFWLKSFLPVFTFLFLIFFQGLFVYAFPYVMIKDRKFIPAFLLGVRFYFKNFFRTFILIGVPMCLYLPVFLLKNNSAFFMQKFSPEVIVPILFFTIIIGTVVVDAFTTVASILYFMGEHHEE